MVYMSGLTENLVERNVLLWEEVLMGGHSGPYANWEFTHSPSQLLPCFLYPIPCHPKLKHMKPGCKRGVYCPMGQWN